jgi:amino acid adenylation domain-containing protein/non-ribosomal peptide synthase protein (TIGR01720 family)
VNIFNYLIYLRSKNIHVWLEQDRLRFKGPAAAITPTLHQELSQYKPEIVSFLHENNKDIFLSLCIHDFFVAHAQYTPNAIALTLEGQHLSYRELDEKSNQLAHFLRSKGVGPDILVGLCVERSFEMVIGLIGILKAGGAYLPLDPHSPIERNNFILNDSKVKLLLTETLFQINFADFGKNIVLLDNDWVSKISPCAKESLCALSTIDNLAYVIYTSGSTGQPKGVEITHRNVLRLFTATQEWFNFDANDVWSLFHSYNFDFSVWEIWGALAYGGRLVIIPFAISRSPEDFYHLLSEQGITVLNQTPSAFRQLMQVEALLTVVPPLMLRLIIFGGEALKLTALRPWFERHGDQIPQLINMYGITETTVHVTYRPIKLNDLSGASSSLIGIPIPDLNLYLLDERLQSVPVGVVGEIYVSGAGVARGYLNQPGLTAQRFMPNPFNTTPGSRLYRSGDLARYLPNGELEYVGRSDDQVKIRGFRLEIKEIEAVLLQHATIHDAVVTTFTRESGDTGLVAYIVSSILISSNQLRSYLREKLPDYMVPAVLIRLEKFPLTINGKIDFDRLPNPTDALLDQQENRDITAARNPIEQKLTALWQEILNQNTIGIHENFFALGGDSILAIQLAAKARREGLTLTPKQLFEAQTIAELAIITSTSPTTTAQQGLIVGKIALTPIQHWFFAQEIMQPQHWNQSILLQCKNKLAPAVMQEVVYHLLQHHDALRHRFSLTAQGYQQHASLPDKQAAFTYHDYSQLQSHEKLPTLVATAAELQASLNLAKGPLFQVALFKLADNESDRLLLIAHHLIIDGISWHILIEDIQLLYTQLMQQQAPKLDLKTTSFQAWADQLQQYANVETLKQELQYWLHQPWSKAITIPLDIHSSQNLEGDVATIQASLSKTETHALLKKVPHAYRTQIQDILLTALTHTFCMANAEQQGETTDALLIDVEGHGRETIFNNLDVIRTVGWFTSIYPVLLQLPKNSDWSAAIKAIKEQLRKIPHHGIGYGILRYLSDALINHQLSSLPQAAISFNYLGQLDNNTNTFFELAPESMGPMRYPKAKRQHVFDITVFISKQQLHISWAYNTQLHNENTVQHYVHCFLNALQEIIHHCNGIEKTIYTPSDFPLIKLSQQKIDSLLQANVNVVDIYPLSSMQQGFLLYHLYAANRSVGIEQTCIKLQGNLNRQAFSQAWQQVIQQHTILRTSFVIDDFEQPLQLVHDNVPLKIDYQDWQLLSVEKQQEQIALYMQNDFNRGFSLTEPPLLRLGLLQIGGNNYYMVWSHHHLLLDGWSVHLVLRQVMDHYSAICSSTKPNISYAPEYKQYITWCLNIKADKSKSYWQTLLQNFIAPTPLIIDRVPQIKLTDKKQQENTLSLSPEQTFSLKSFAQQNHISLNTMIQAAWALILHHYSNHQTVVFGTTASGRPPELDGIEEMVGMFINIIPVVINITKDEAVLLWLKNLHKQQLAQREHEYTPLFQIQEWCGISAMQPLFDSLLIVENYPTTFRDNARNDTLTFHQIDSAVHTRYPLTVVVVPEKELSVYIYYDSDRFSANMIAQLLTHWQTILLNLTNVQQAVTSLSILSETEKNILQSWSQAKENQIAILSSPLKDITNKCYKYLLNDNHQLVPIGIPGKLYLSQTLQLIGDYLATDFIARYHPDGQLEYLGRESDPAFIRNNEKIFLKEIENRLNEHSAIIQSLILAQTTAQENLILIAYYSVMPEVTITPEDLNRWLKKFFLASWLPDAYVSVSTEILLHTHHLLPQAQPSDYVYQWQYIAPRTHIENVIAEICTQLIKVKQISVTDDFFALGGQSILAIQLIARIRNVLGLSLPIRELFARRTIENIAHYIEQQLITQATNVGTATTNVTSDDLTWDTALSQYPLQKLPSLPYYEVSPYQLPELFFNSLSPDSPMYNILSCDVLFTGKMNLEAARYALEIIINRHNVFRTYFGYRDGKPVQFVQSKRSINITDIYLDYRHVSADNYLVESTRLAHEFAAVALDFKTGPLFLFKFAEFPGQKFLLIFLTNHVVWDEVSLLNFAAEFKFLYNSHNVGKIASLPPLAFDYTDYTHWVNALVAGGKLDQQKNYWINRFADRPQALDLPVDFPRPPIQTFNGSDVSGTLPRVSVDKLFADMAQNNNHITLSNFLLSLTSLLLFRLTGQHDIIIGMPFANRIDQRLENIMGPFAVGLPIRLHLKEQMTFVELLNHTQQVTLEALENSLYPGVLAIQEINPDWDMSRARLYPVMFGLQHNKTNFWSDMKLDGLETSRPEHLQNIGPLHSTARCDLRIITEHLFEDIWYSFSYNSDLFLRSSIERITAQFSFLFEQVINNPNLLLNKYRMITPEQEQHILITMNQTKKITPFKSIHSQFELQAEINPRAIALHYDGLELTYVELNEKANQLAYRLQTLGAKLETTIAVYLDKSPAVIIAILAILKTGATFLPLDTSLPLERVTTILQIADSKIFLTSELLAENFTNYNGEVVILKPDLSNIFDTKKGNLLLHVKEQQLAYVIFTSGSTGTPKGVMIHHAGIANRIRAALDAHPLQTGDAVLQYSSISFDVSILEIFTTLLSGAKLVIASAEQTKNLTYIINLLSKQQITMANFTPSLLKIILDEIPYNQCAALKYIYCGGESMPAKFTSQVHEKLPQATLYNVYGPTEISIDATCYTCNSDSSFYSMPIGQPLCNLQVYVLDTQLQPLPIGIAGELYIGGVGIARGYVKQPQLTAECFIPDRFSGVFGARLYKTGDRVRWLADGNLEFLGRIDRQIKVRGNRVELNEIEAQLATHASIKLCAIRYHQDTLLAYIELHQNSHSFVINTTRYQLYSLAQRPELKKIADHLHRSAWPDYFAGDAVMQTYWPRLANEFGPYQFLLLNDNNSVVALGNAIPIYWDGTLANLPVGWDDGLERGFNTNSNTLPNTLLILAAVTATEHMGSGLSSGILQAFKAIALTHHLEHLIAPVRPTGKTQFPHMTFSDYCNLKREDGLSVDNWLRTHERIKGKILKISLQSQLIKAGLADWQTWVDCPLTISGLQQFKDTLQPANVNIEAGYVEYYDPCVWIEHPLQSELDTSSTTDFHYVDGTDLNHYLRNFLPEYMLPNSYFFITKMPLTTSGKVNLQALTKLDQNYQEQREYIAPCTLIQKKLAIIWQQILQLELISNNDNFFNIGGHSIKAMQLVAKINDIFNINLRLKDIFKDPTICGLEKLLQATLAGSVAAKTVEESTVVME